MAGCYRVHVSLGGHHHELVVVAVSEADAAKKARRLYTDKSVRAGSEYYVGRTETPLVGLVTYEHDDVIHGSGGERRRMNAWRRYAHEIERGKQ